MDLFRNRPKTPDASAQTDSEMKDSSDRGSTAIDSDNNEDHDDDDEEMPPSSVQGSEDEEMPPAVRIAVDVLVYLGERAKNNKKGAPKTWTPIPVKDAEVVWSESDGLTDDLVEAAAHACEEHYDGIANIILEAYYSQKRETKVTVFIKSHPGFPKTLKARRELTDELLPEFLEQAALHSDREVGMSITMTNPTAVKAKSVKVCFDLNST